MHYIPKYEINKDESMLIVVNYWRSKWRRIGESFTEVGVGVRVGMGVCGRGHRDSSGAGKSTDPRTEDREQP